MINIFGHVWSHTNNHFNYTVCVSILLFFSLVKQKQLLGPGTYNINDFIDQMAKKPGSTRGVCETREARFDTTKMVCSKIMLPSSTHGQLHVHVSSITFSIQDNWQRSALEKKKENPTI